MAAGDGLRQTLAGSILAALAYGWALVAGSSLRAPALLLTLGSALLVTGLMRLGLARRGRGTGPMRWVLGFVFVALAGGFILALFLPGGERPGSALLGGLPLRAALVIYGVGLLPALVLPLAYALTFRGEILDADAVERIRALRAAPDDDASG
jgi:hypothetical protein